jgi:hypothetical protein
MFASKGHNPTPIEALLQADAIAGLTNGSNGDLVGSVAAPLNPNLGPLQSNGGPTPTCALLPGSSAIDAGDRLGVPVTDQRGYPRLIGSAPDIGAFEFWPSSRLQSNGRELELQVIGGPGKKCIVQTSANFRDWMTVANQVTDMNGTTVFRDIAAHPQQLYRSFFVVENTPVLAVTTATASVHGSSTNSLDADIKSSAVTAKVTGETLPYQEVSWEYVSGSSLIVPANKTALKTTFHGVTPYNSQLQSRYRLKIVDAAEDVAYGPPVLITLINSAPVVREDPRAPRGRYLP